MPDPTPAHRRLLRDLIAAREAAGLSQSELGDRIGWLQARVSRIETGAARPKPDDVARWLRASNAPADVLERLVEASKDLAVETRTWGRRDESDDPAAQQAIYAAREAAATKIVFFQPTMIPAFAQTDEYAEAILRYYYPAGDAAAAAGARMERSMRALHRPSVPVILIIHEQALTRRLVPDRILHRQLDRLAEMIDDPELSHVTIAVVPAGLPEPDPASSAVLMLEGDIPMAFAEYRVGESKVYDAALLDTYRASFDAWLKVALTGDDAKAIIRRAAAKLPS